MSWISIKDKKPKKYHVVLWKKRSKRRVGYLNVLNRIVTCAGWGINYVETIQRTDNSLYWMELP